MRQTESTEAFLTEKVCQPIDALGVVSLRKRTIGHPKDSLRESFSFCFNLVLC